MNLPKRGDLIAAAIPQEFDHSDCLPMLVVDVDPHGFWEDDIPTICGMWLGSLGEMRTYLRTEEPPKLIVSVYGPHPSRFCFTEPSYQNDEHLRWDLVHVHTHAYLPATESALENIEIVGHVTEEVLSEVREKGNQWLGVVPQVASGKEYTEYVEVLMQLCQDYHEGARTFWARYGSGQNPGMALAR